VQAVGAHVELQSETDDNTLIGQHFLNSINIITRLNTISSQRLRHALLLKLLFNIFKGNILYFEEISPEKIYIKNYPPVFGRKTCWWQ